MSRPSGVLDVPVAEEVRFEETAYTSALQELLDEHEPYCVALVDQRTARFFVVRLGETAEPDTLRSVVPQRHRQGGGELGRGASARYPRHHDRAVRQHMQAAGARLVDLRRKFPFNRLIIGGPIKARAAFEATLPQELRALVLDRIALRANAPAHAVLAATARIEYDAERRHEQALVTRLLASAAGTAGAVIGPDATVHALLERRVLKLVAASGWRASGKSCPRCGFLTRGFVGPCPRCGSSIAAVDNLSDRLVEASAVLGVPVEFVRDGARERLVAEGAVGAFVITASSSGRDKSRTEKSTRQ